MQPLGLDQAPVHVHRPDHRLGGIGQDRLLGPPPGEVLAPTQAQALGNSEVKAQLGRAPGC